MATSPLRPQFSDLPQYNAPEFTGADVAAIDAGSNDPFTRGVDSALGGMLANHTLGQAAALEQAGKEFQQLRDSGLADLSAAAARGPRVSSLRDVNNVGDALELGIGSTGQAVGSMFPTIVAAALTRGRLRAPASLVTAYNLETDEALGNQYADPTLAATDINDRMLAARSKGIINAGLDSVVPMGLASGALRSAGGRLANIGRGMFEEGLTEGVQEGVGFGAEKYLDPSRKFDPVRIADATLAGALGGGFMTGAANLPGAIADRIHTTQNRQPPPAAAAAPQVQAQQGPAAEPPMDAAPPGTPPPPGPTDGDGGGLGGLYDTLNDRFGPELRDRAQKTKDYVSDTIDRMGEAAKTAQSPGEFLQQVFGSSSEEAAAADLRPDTEDPSVMNSSDPAAALAERDAQRQQRAAMFAEELLNDPATPDAIKERVASFGGDFTNPEARAFVARNLVSQRAGEKLVTAIGDLFDLSKDFGGKVAEAGTDLAGKARDMLNKGMTAAADRIVKKNLQDIPLTEAKPLIDTLAQRLGPSGAAEAPELARQLLAVSVRLSPDARISPAADKRLRNLSEVVDDDVLDTVTEVSGSDGLRQALARIRAIPSAMNDVAASKGSSFMESMLVQPMSAGQLKQLARVVDDAGLQLKGMNETRRNQLLTGLGAAFGSERNAQTVVEYYGNLRREAMQQEAETDPGPVPHYYQQQNRDDVRFEHPTQSADNAYEGSTDSTYEDAASTAEWGALSENDGPKTQYGFRHGATKRPFRKFVGEQLSNGRTRREAVRAVTDARGREDMNYSYVGYGDYLKEQGVSAQQGVADHLRYIDATIKEHESRKGEDRSASIAALHGERALLERRVAEHGAEKALNDLYEVTARAERGDAELTASDDDIREMKRGVKRPNTSGMSKYEKAKALEQYERTLVRFTSEDGEPLTLSAKSMVASMGTKRGRTGKVNEASEQNDRDTLKEAVASVMARGYALDSDIRSVTLEPGGMPVFGTRTKERRNAVNAYASTTHWGTYSEAIAAAQASADKILKRLEAAIDRAGAPEAHDYTRMLSEKTSHIVREIRQQAEHVRDAVAETRRAKEEALERWRKTEMPDKGDVWASYVAARARADFERDMAEIYIAANSAARTMMRDAKKLGEDLERSGVTEADESGGLDRDAERLMLERRRDMFSDRRIEAMRAGDIEGTDRAQLVLDRVGERLKALDNEDAKSAARVGSTPGRLREEKAPKVGYSTQPAVDRRQTNTRTDAILAANPELLQVLDSYGEPKDKKWSESQIRERVYEAYAKLPITALKTRREALRERYKGAKGQEAETIKHIGQLIDSVLEKRGPKSEASAEKKAPNTAPKATESGVRLPAVNAAVSKALEPVLGKYADEGSRVAQLSDSDYAAWRNQAVRDAVAGKDTERNYMLVAMLDKYVWLYDSHTNTTESLAKARKGKYWEKSIEGKVRAALEAEPEPKTISDAAINALYDVAVKENYDRLDTPEKVLRYAAMARALVDQLAQIPEDARTDQQDVLLSKLRADFKQGGNAAFDWNMLFDGMKPTAEQRALLEDIVSAGNGAERVRKNSFVGAKADPEGAKRAAEALKSEPADVVRSALGWFKGPDGKLRKEIRSPVLKGRARDLARRIVAGDGRKHSVLSLLDGVPGFENYKDTWLKDTVIDPRGGLVELGGDVGVFVPPNYFGAFGVPNTIELSRAGAELGMYIARHGRDAIDAVVAAAQERGEPVFDAHSANEVLRTAYPMDAAERNGAVAEELASTLLHELQHAFQALEGFENGGSPAGAVIAKYGDVDGYIKAVEDGDIAAMEAISNQADDLFLADIGLGADPVAAAHALYEDIVGEVEASDVQGRMNLTDEEARAIKPALANAERNFVRSVIPQIALSMINAKLGSASAMGAKKGRPKKTAQQESEAAVVAEILKTRGKEVKVEVDKLVSELGGSGEYEYTPATGERIVRVAINAHDVLGTARHEAMHDFFRMLGTERWARNIKRDLLNAVSAPHVKKQLRELLKDHPAAIEQVNSDPEEALAYAYQFWAAGTNGFKLGPTGTNIFRRIWAAIQNILGVVSQGEAAEAVFRDLRDGNLADMSVAQQVIEGNMSKTIGQKLRALSPEIADLGRKLVQAGSDRLRDFGTNETRVLADDFDKFIRERMRQDAVWHGKFFKLVEGTTSADRAKALRNLQSRRVPTTPLETGLRSLLDELHDYMSSAGVLSLSTDGENKWEPLRKVKDYFPQSWDRDAIRKDMQGWIDLNAKYGLKEAAARAVADKIMRGSGQYELAESDHHLGFVPFNESTMARTMAHINAQNAHEFAKFQRSDLGEIMTGYIKQASHRAEYARLFDNNGERIARIAANLKLSGKQAEDFTNTVRGLEGTLSPELSYDAKATMSGLMALQNAVLLPLAIFSQVVDPVAMAARSEDIKDAGRAFTTALKNLKRTITRSGEKLDGEDLAEILGIVSRDSVLDAMGVAYGSSFQGRGAAKFNQMFFRWNGMQGWNNSMRIAATAAGERYLLANKKNREALRELGLEPSDIKVKNKRLDVSDPKVQKAMYQFVDEAVLRPTASNRPVWMSDPRFMLVSHLKQFTFAMHNVVLKRAMKQLDEGNVKPMATLMLAMPVVLAGDIAKSVLTGTPNMSGWGFMDYVARAVERSGLLGIGDFGTQATRGVNMGKVPGEGLMGPTLENLMEILRWIGGDPRTGIGDVIDRTVPGSRFI